MVAAGNDAGGAVFGGEVGHRPDRVALNLVASWNGKEIERPLVAMNRLRGLVRADRDYLRQMELEAGRVAEHLADAAEHRRMHHELAAFRRARNQSAGATRAMAAEVVGAERSRLDERMQFGLNLVHHFGRDDSIDDDHSVLVRCAR